MPRKRLESLHRLMEDGFDPPSDESDEDLGLALQVLCPREQLAIRTRFLGKQIASFEQVGKRLKTNRNEASRVVQIALEKLEAALRR